MQVETQSDYGLGIGASCLLNY